MLGLTLETAKTIAVVAAVAFVAFAIASAWLVKSIIGKLIAIGILVALAVLMWSQRTNLTQCADRAEQQVSSGQANVTCTFFGTDVTING